MNEAMLKDIKKHMKISETSVITPQVLVMAYLKPETEEPLFVKETYFEQLELDEKQMLMANFRKVISGQMNRKMFELEFKEEADSHTQDALLEMLELTNRQDFAIASNIIIQKIIDNFMYDQSVVVSILKFQYSTEEEIFNFIISAVNKVDNQKGVFVFDHNVDNTQSEFTAKYYAEPEVNLSTPQDGFMFPSVEVSSQNVNKIINYYKKNDEINALYISEVLDAEVVLTAKQEKNYFNEILRQCLGEKVKPRVLAKIYEIISHTFDLEEELEDRVLYRGQLERILTAQIGELEVDIEDVYEDVMAIQNYGFKIDNILPDFGKRSISIKSDEADIAVEPRALNKIRQVKSADGGMYLMIKIDNDSTADGIAFDSDEIETIVFGDEE